MTMHVAPTRAAATSPDHASDEEAIRAAYERTHPGDSFADLKRRAVYSRGDAGLLREWIRAFRPDVPRAVGLVAPKAARGRA